MRRTGAWLAVHALEQIGVRWTFGIPGVHNTELYDELSKSERITPVLVTHECCGAFMADAISRTSTSIGTLAIVPAAGMTHALSGIGEAYLDGIPMLILSGGIRRDTGRHYQLHQIDQLKILEGITKKAVVVRDHESVIPTIYEAYGIATSGEPGPVFVEIPGEVMMFAGEAGEPPRFAPPGYHAAPEGDGVRRAASLLKQARRPGLYAGWGARDCADRLIAIADMLGAPVSTTLQGLSVFPANHPLHTGMGFGASAVPAARAAFADCDCLLAVGVRFAELATGSYGMKIPEKLIHIDINPAVFNKNYPAAVAIEGDAGAVLDALLAELSGTEAGAGGQRREELSGLISREKAEYRRSWLGSSRAGLVNPAVFFGELRRQLADDAILAVDDGNHTFLAAELFPVHRSRAFISPADFNCMGYCVPAAIGAKLANPERQVVAVTGDGAFLMTGLETLTASTLELGVVIFVFHDGELGQISRFQQIPLNRKTCSVLGDLQVEGIARATGAHFISMGDDGAVPDVIAESMKVADSGQPVIVDVKIDYSRSSSFTKGVVKVNLGRFSLREKLRFLGRAVARHAFK